MQRNRRLVCTAISVAIYLHVSDNAWRFILASERDKHVIASGTCRRCVWLTTRRVGPIPGTGKIGSTPEMLRCGTTPIHFWYFRLIYYADAPEAGMSLFYQLFFG
jgi:hypothetical protein